MSINNVSTTYTEEQLLELRRSTAETSTQKSGALSPKKSPRLFNEPCKPVRNEDFFHDDDNVNSPAVPSFG